MNVAEGIVNEDITFVVQGPVQASEGRKQIEGITSQCVRSIRQHFPGSVILLSTWKGQPTSGLDYDRLLELDDPGSNIIYVNDSPVTLNNNRQLVSSHQGLKQVTTKYAVKLRSDNLISGRGFVELFEKYHQKNRDESDSLFSARIVTSSAFFISHHRGAPIHFCKSDLFDFGLTSDLLKVWSEPLVPELRFYPKVGYKSRPPSTEQFLCLKWLSELMGKPLNIQNRVYDDANLGQDFWHRFIASNIIIGKPEELGLDTTERFYRRGNLVFEYDLEDWLVIAGFLKPSCSLKTIIRTIRNLIEGSKRQLYKLSPSKKRYQGY